MISMKTGLLSLAGVLALGLAMPAQASVTLVTSRAGLAGDDSIDWSVLGGTFTRVSNPFSTSTVGSLGLTVSQSSGSFMRRDQGNGWSGNFNPGDALLWTQ